MMASFKLEVVTPDRAVLDEPVESLVVPAFEGYLGVLANHAPLLCVIRPGEVSVISGGKTRRFAVGSGFLEVGGNRAILLADLIEPVEGLNRESLSKSREAVRARIAAREDVEKNREELERLDQWLKLSSRR
jgi:F-type H+-transporting ATPase subunit epsilon